MNAVEHIVEAYYRICNGCFTMHDVKVLKGNNRQFDLLAVSLKTNDQYHVESSVMPGWPPSMKDLEEGFDKKFLGFPAKREGETTDYGKGKTYRKQIDETYASVGLNPLKINRVWVTWAISDNEAEKLPSFIADYNSKNGIRVDVLSLQKLIIPNLLNKVETANYDDELLRTMSLVKQTLGPRPNVSPKSI